MLFDAIKPKNGIRYLLNLVIPKVKGSSLLHADKTIRYIFDLVA